MVERTAGGRKCPLQIFQDVVRLQLDIRSVIRKGRIGLCLGWDAILKIGSKLTGGENQIADAKGFRVVRDGFGLSEVTAVTFMSSPVTSIGSGTQRRFSQNV